MIVVTGASGKLGHLIIGALCAKTAAGNVVAAVRTVSKAADIVARGVSVRHADYDDAMSLPEAFEGADVVVLVSSNEIGKRYPQHLNVIRAAKAAGVSRIVYTSLLHADVSPLSLAGEHVETERAIKESGLSYTILRNGWYTENYTGSIPAALANGVLLGAAGVGRISSAARTDYAEAAAVAALSEDGGNRVYELAGDSAYTLADLAAEVSRQTGRKIPYRNLTETEYAAALVKAGLPKPLAEAVAGWDAGVVKGALFDDGRALSRLIGHPTTPLAKVVASALSR